MRSAIDPTLIASDQGNLPAYNAATAVATPVLLDTWASSLVRDSAPPIGIPAVPVSPYRPLDAAPRGHRERVDADPHSGVCGDAVRHRPAGGVVVLVVPIPDGAAPDGARCCG
jgi:hypothetical protein